MTILDIIKEKKALLVLAALGAGVFAYEWYQFARDDLVATASAKPAEQKQRGVLAEGRVATYPGAEVTLSAELTAKLVKLGVKERDRVKAGDVIGELDVREHFAAREEALSRVKEADADMRYFALERGRTERLLSQSAVAEAELDRRKYETKSAGHRRSSLRATANRIDVFVDKAKLVAPIDGSITARYADAGEMVAAGSPVVTIADLEKLRVEAEVGEFDAARVRLGAAVTITAEGYDGVTWKGSVEEIPDQVIARQQKPLDPSRPVDTRILLVKVRLDEPVPLKLGQRVEVEIAR